MSDEACGKCIPCRIGTLPPLRDRRPDRDRPAAPHGSHPARGPLGGRARRLALRARHRRPEPAHERPAPLRRRVRRALREGVCPAGVCRPLRVVARHERDSDRPRAWGRSPPPRRPRRTPPPSGSSPPRRRSARSPRPAFTIEVDGRRLPAFEGQTILEVCRANGIEVPTLCYEPKLPGFGACRMCVVEVEGEEQPPISCSREAEPGMVVRTQTPRLREIRKTNLELIFSDHNAYCLPPCQNKCPSHIDIPGFLKANTEGEFVESARIFKRTIPFPSVLGRVCPAPCEEHCRRDEVDEAIAIRDSHRYAGDQVLRAQAHGRGRPVPFTLQASDREARGGRRVRPGRRLGRLLPRHRRPLGHDLRPGPRAGRDAPVRDPGVPAAEGRGSRRRVPVPLGPRHRVRRARPSWDARSPWRTSRHRATTPCALPSAATTPNKLGVPGEDAEGVLEGLDYLRTATLGLPYPGHAGSRVVVIGGGFTAMDCTRTSIRQGAREVTLVYRRDMKEMPAASEVHEALEEGAVMIFQAAPTRVLVDDRNRATGVEFQRMQMGAPDASGRRRPEPVAGTEFVIECDRVLLAIGQGPDLSWAATGAEGVGATKNRRLAADAVTFATGRPGCLRRRRRPDRRLHRRPGDRGGPARGLRHRRVPAGHGPRGDPDPPGARRAGTPVPLHRPVHGRGEGATVSPEGDASRGARGELRRVRDPVHAGRGDGRIAALPPVHLRGHRVLRPAAPRDRVRHDTPHPRPGSHRPEPPQRHGEPLHRVQPRLHPRRQPRLHPAGAVALHRLRALRERLQGGRGRGLLRLHAHWASTPS